MALIERHSELFDAALAAEGRKPRPPSRRFAAVINRALARMDRYANFGAGRPGAGLEWAITHLEADVEEVRWNRRRQAPVSVAYYAPLLDEVSKQWRRNQAPRSPSAPPGWRPSWANPKEKGAGGSGNSRRRHNR